ncbi:unnamed protein product, partial [Mesorhabditis belari]|uniref:RING-type domain-containing protein n=1 Tax=Mesorhabditis belari TaxID=2138241 RepID=A0AAF3EPG0_9BILA
MELLASGAFKLDQEGKGYVQTTQSITIPECPSCQEEYSLRDAKKEPFTLHCGHTVSLLEMFQCMDCGDKMLCSRCSCKNHRLHQIIDLEVVEKLWQVTRETIIPQIEAYNACFPELQSNLIKNFNKCQKKILSRTDQVAYFNGFAEAKEQQKACLAFGERFETICEKYLGELRSFNTGIEKLIDDINESPK